MIYNVHLQGLQDFCMVADCFHTVTLFIQIIGFVAACTARKGGLLLPQIQAPNEISTDS
jgi:hypothetical protein